MMQGWVPTGSMTSRSWSVSWVPTPSGSPADGEPPTIEATIDRSELVVVVTNAVSGDATTPSDADWDLSDPLRTGGRGLLLVSAFVDHVGVEVEGGRLVVRCTTAL